MKSVEVKFNEALEKLKKISASKYEEVWGKIRQAGFLPIETQLNMVEAGIAEVKESAPVLGLTNIDEAKRDYAVLFGVEPKAQATTKEKAQPIKKNNGAAENFVEGSPFNGDRGNATTESNPRKDVCSTSDKILFDGLLKLGKITEAEHRKLTGKKPEGYEQLSEQQRKEFDFARLIGIGEADAFTLAKMTSTFKEVSR